jgi:small subunit ribosomal protein S9
MAEKKKTETTQAAVEEKAADVKLKKKTSTAAEKKAADKAADKAEATTEKPKKTEKAATGAKKETAAKKAATPKKAAAKKTSAKDKKAEADAGGAAETKKKPAAKKAAAKKPASGKADAKKAAASKAAAPKAPAAQAAKARTQAKTSRPKLDLPKPTVSYWGTGRRKNAIARVRIFPGSGRLFANGRDGLEYFGRQALLNYIKVPFKAVDSLGKFDVVALLSGGGISGQAGALRLGIARALLEASEDFRAGLKRAGLLRRDPRMVERKKYGLKKARKRPQFSKR